LYPDGVIFKKGEHTISLISIRKVILIVILLTGILVMIEGYSIISENTRPKYSELGVLGPDMKIGDYPTVLNVGDNVTLYAYVGNHEEATKNYTVLVKLGKSSSKINNTTPMNAPIVGELNFVIQKGDNYTAPVNIKFEEAGQNQKIVFELWVYSQTSGEIVYGGQWVQILVTVRP
jgi:uncharacterized membrane protein